ncbi:MAG: hypothetical protein JO349_05520 [Candidatus Eremiobacteraeota bacterium]|nr:hypothetical protein [Candidatus Eremiobacteraeota bacterium]
MSDVLAATSVAPSYTVLFDFRQPSFAPIFVTILPLLILAYAIPAIIIHKRKRNPKNPKAMINYVAFCVMAAFISIVVVPMVIADAVKDWRAYSAGAYHVAEGPVQGYSVYPGGKLEWFTVGGVRFEVSCCYASVRYHHTPYDGGHDPIQNGENLRITYLAPDEILRIEKRE